MVDAARADPMEFIKPHPFNGFDSRGIAIGISGQQFAPDILQTMPVVLELEQHGDHLGLEHLRIIGCRQTGCEGIRTGLRLEERRAMAYHVEPCGTSIRRCIGHQLCGDHGGPVGCEHRTICQFKVQQPVVFVFLDFLLSKVHQEFPVRAFHKHAVSRGERVMVQRNQFDVLQLRQGCRWTDQPLDIVDVFVLLVFPKDDAPVFTGTVEPCGQQFGNLVEITHCRSSPLLSGSTYRVVRPAPTRRTSPESAMLLMMRCA